MNLVASEQRLKKSGSEVKSEWQRSVQKLLIMVYIYTQHIYVTRINLMPEDSANVNLVH